MSTTESVLETPQLAEGSLLDEIMQQTRIAPSEDGYDIAKKGVAAFIENLLGSPQSEEPVNKSLVDQMLVELDKKVSAQMDEILHNADYQQMESSWRGLKLFIDRTDFRENNKVEILHVTKDELLEDFEFAPETCQAGLYKHVYSSGYGQFGGEPTGAIIGNYAFSPSTPDMKLLQYMGALGAMSHAPFISSVGPEFFGIDSFEELPNIKDLKSTFESPKYTKWRSLRESEDARYLGLTAPRFLLRVPYDPTENPIKSFNYTENVSSSHEHYLWGNTAFAFATRLTDSFAKYRWCPNIIGPQSGGAVEDLPVHVFESMGALQSKIPTEVLITDRKEFELAEEGFIALTMRKGSDNAAFFSANSIQKPKIFPNTKEGKEAETNYKLGTQLPYMMIINRLAHYVKVLQREQIGAWKERQDLERELNTWIKQYVADQENPPADVRSRRPLRAARIEVADVEGNPGWYQVSLSVRPHFKYMGANFELSLVGRLDQA
ncbi:MULTISPECIES: type VI secretion system contractile sheath large subunit [Vibrio]|jgi:type VI secretion system protein ImpC|uniref:Type VI secretion protein n=2 Tax=Vibrio rotiferianus TaxID=190895 RepID=A0A2K7SWK4_9VIBR|nr:MULTISPECIES: type VI secretion system contractile sheath large subunit [Vibrio]MDK9778281.1 type VI secretion system contractile sheath large subunit [Vibrio sp. D401a]MDK9805401.1 type VI secretion system contractile sheath large subunit [Vibrio sp. D406a]NOH50999.1 type VI secretion system contractile sheath large subunit [Vibrio rotiferianus]OHY94223.1 type VI secretion protein [Vibrio rotiferianus]USD52147.1 type VI secretion system contractile sheath large subunit [Vibrio sp. SCSIO 43